MSARERELREIWNNGDREYREIFDGKKISIPAHDCVVMERSESVKFLGTHKGFNKEIESGLKPLSWKPAKQGAKATVFPIHGEDAYETVVTPVKQRRPLPESADSIKELEHLAGA